MNLSMDTFIKIVDHLKFTDHWEQSGDQQSWLSKGLPKAEHFKRSVIIKMLNLSRHLTEATQKVSSSRAQEREA